MAAVRNIVSSHYLVIISNTLGIWKSCNLFPFSSITYTSLEKGKGKVPVL